MLATNSSFTCKHASHLYLDLCRRAMHIAASLDPSLLVGMQAIS